MGTDAWHDGFDPMLRESTRDGRARIEMTVACRDSDPLPRVADAGQIQEQDGTRVQVMFNGVRVPAGGYFGDWMSEIIERLHGHHEPQEELVFHEVLKHVADDGVILELGAFWAWYSVWFLHGAPGRRAIAVEPDLPNLEVGRSTAALNDVTVEFIHAGVGGTHQDAVEFVSELGNGSFTIPVLTVEEILADRAVEHLAVLHCDTQGQELAVIESCEQLLRAGRIRFVLVSTHSHHICGDPLIHQRCLTRLREYGGRILAEHDVHESFSGDGMIAAVFGDPLDWQAPPMSYNRQSTSLFRPLAVDLDEAFDEIGQLRAQLERTDRELATAREQLAARPSTGAALGTLAALPRRAVRRATRRLRRG